MTEVRRAVSSRPRSSGRQSLLLTILLLSLPAVSVQARAAHRNRFDDFAIRSEGLGEPDLEHQLAIAGEAAWRVRERVGLAYQLPEALTLWARRCDRPQVYYTPAQRTITLCYEWIDALLATPAIARRPVPDSASVAALEFVILHELGHALIGLLDLPVTGSEEAAADQFAVFDLLERGRALPAATTNALLSNWAIGESSDLARLADTHGLHAQRSINLDCWLYGGDAAWRASTDALPDADSAIPFARRQDCLGEYRNLPRTWTRLLGRALLHAAHSPK